METKPTNNQANMTPPSSPEPVTEGETPLYFRTSKDLIEFAKQNGIKENGLEKLRISGSAQPHAVHFPAIFHLNRQIFGVTEKDQIIIIDAREEAKCFINGEGIFPVLM